MQLMPGTAKQLGVTDPWDMKQNIMGGSKYLRMMLDEFGGNLKKAVAAYNCGPGNVRKAEKRGLEVPNIEETKNYVPAVLAHAQKFNNGAPIVVPGGETVSVAAVAQTQIQPQKIDYALVVEAIHSADVMTQTAMSLAITSNVQPIDLPERSKGSDEPPPPPPPSRSARV
jgi:hypothetical protein